MYFSLNGILIHKSVSVAVIECGGVGYKCFCSYNTIRLLPSVGSEAFLFTHLQVREDAMDLYGFFDQTELEYFKLLTTVSGVGGKAAMAILSELDCDRLSLCIAAGDYKQLQRAQGVGPKLAQRIVVDLKDKMAASGAVGADFAAAVSAGVSSNYDDAIDALVALGFARGDAAAAVASFAADASVEDMITGGLKALSGNK